jgi:transposase
VGGGARSELVVRLNRRGPERRRTAEDTIVLIGRLAAHHPDRQIAAILSQQGRRTGTDLPFTEARVRATRQRAGIAAAPPPDPHSELVTIAEAAVALGVSTATIRRWLGEGLLPGEQVTPHAPWRIRLSDDVRRRFVPEVPEGFMKLDEAAKHLGVARQTVLHQVQRGERQFRPRHPREARRASDSGLRLRRWTVCPVTESRGAV